MASQINGRSNVCSTACPGLQHKKGKARSLAHCIVINRWPMDCSQKVNYTEFPYEFPFLSTVITQVTIRLIYSPHRSICLYGVLVLSNTDYTHSDQTLIVYSWLAMTPIFRNARWTLPWRHNECDGVSNHRRLACLLIRLFKRRSKKTPKLRVIGFMRGPVNSPHKGPVTHKMFPFDDFIMKSLWGNERVSFQFLPKHIILWRHIHEQIQP